jgi:hypothetical protein
MPQFTPEYHVKRYTSLKNNRAALDNYVQECAYYCMPRKAFITRFHNIGDRLPDDLYDNTAINSVDYAAAGIQGYLTNPAMRWFGLMLQNRAMMAIPGARNYLRDCEDVIYDTLNHSNFYQENNECYRDLLVIATHCLYEEEDVEDDVRFLSVPFENAVFAGDANGRIRTVYIKYVYTADQAVQKFGLDKLSKECQEAYAKLNFEKTFEFLYCVYPRAVYNPFKQDRQNMPYATEWIDMKEKAQIKEGGYKQFPFAVSRWAKTSNDIHGSGPAMNELPNIKTLNAMCRTNLIAGEKVADPPKMIPDEAFLRPYDFDAGGINIKATGYPNEKIEPILGGENVPFGLEFEDARRRMIQHAFFNDLFIILNQTSNMTAEEVRARVAERMLLLGPAIGMIIQENLRPVIERTFAICDRLGKLPKPPKALEGQPYSVIATSPLARAQREVELNGLRMSMGVINELAQVQMQTGQYPEVLDKFKFDEAADFVAEVTNLNAKLIRDDAEVDDIRANRAAAQAMAQNMEMLKQGADAVKTGSEADKNLATIGAGK